MRRLLLVIVCAGLLSANAAFQLRPENFAPFLGCSNPTVQSGYEDGIAFPGGFRTNVDGWTHTGRYTMSVCSPSDWSVVAKQKTGLLQVRAYPDSERTFTDNATCASQVPLGQFTKLKSTFSHVLPSVKTSFDAAYDLFLDGERCGQGLVEVMVWTRWVNVAVPAPQLHITVDGIAYDIYHSGSYIQVRMVEQRDSGAVNFKHLFEAMYGVGLLKPTDSLAFLRYGIEVLSSYGKNATFAVDGFTVKDAF